MAQAGLSVHLSRSVPSVLPMSFVSANVRGKNASTGLRTVFGHRFHRNSVDTLAGR